MAGIILDQGGPWDLWRLPEILGSHEGRFQHGDIGQLELQCRAGFLADVASKVVGAIDSVGLAEWHEVTTSGNSVFIRIREESPFPWVFVAGIVAGVLAVIALFAIANWVFKLFPGGDGLGLGLSPLLFLVILGVGTYLLTKR